MKSRWSDAEARKSRERHAPRRDDALALHVYMSPPIGAQTATGATRPLEGGIAAAFPR